MGGKDYPIEGSKRSVNGYYLSNAEFAAKIRNLD